jgi:hypothetical protein
MRHSLRGNVSGFSMVLMVYFVMHEEGTYGDNLICGMCFLPVIEERIKKLVTSNNIATFKENRFSSCYQNSF